MSYRGDDLDLRLPPGRASKARGTFDEPDRRMDANGTRYRVKAHRHDRTAPLWVDDVVLAVCNAAHEVAEALHSPEVLLQHLVHGMTRVSTAARALENLGVDIQALQRDVTALISSTAARNPDVDLPLTSSEFKAAMRLAGEAAARRGGDTITVEDLLDVLMNYDSDHRGIQLLLSHVRDGEPESSSVLTEPLHGIAQEPNRRRAPPPEAAPRAYYQETPSYGELPGAFNSMEERVIARLTTLDSNYRSEIIHLRDTLADQLRNIERTAASNRGSSDGSAPIISRLQGLERLFETRLEDVSLRWNALGDQVLSIETALAHQSRETAEMKELLGGEMKMIGKSLGDLKIDVPDFDEAFGGRLDTIETMLLDYQGESGGAGLGDDDLARMEELLEGHRKQIAASMHERERNWTAVNERLNKLEHIMTSQHEVAQSSAADRKRIFSSVFERIAGLEELVQSPGKTSGPGNEILVDMNKTLGGMSRAQKTTAEFFDQWRLEMSGDFTVLNNRLENLERNSTRPVAMLDALSTNMRNLKSQMVEKREPQPEQHMHQQRPATHAPRPLQRPHYDDGLWARFSSWMFGPR